MEVSVIITALSLAFGALGTAAAIYFASHSNKFINVPTLDLRMTGLPPYKDNQDATEIVVKNVGRRTSGSVKVSVSSSWDDDIEYNLKFPSDKWVLQPNEEYKWKIRLNYLGSVHNAKVTVIARDGSMNWQISERIS